MANYVLYDCLQVAGGAERVAIDLAHSLPDTSLVVSRVYEEALSLNPFLKLDKGRIKCIGKISSSPKLRLLDSVSSFIFRTQFLENAEAVIYSGAYAPFSVINQKRGRRSYYCHTPPRYMYDWRAHYLEQTPLFFRPALSRIIELLRVRYESSIMEMDIVISNSENIKKRLKKYLGIDSEVIYPPVDIDRFRWVEQGNYFISLARLEPHKGVDRIIAAFKKSPKLNLVVASGGSDQMRLMALAGNSSNIKFVGWQTDEQLSRLIGCARAVIYLSNDEDFGMSPVEAMSAGKPVIGLRNGGLIETVVEGETGVLLSPNASTEMLVDAILTMTPEYALRMRYSCELRANKFAKDIFLQKMRDRVF